MEREKSVKLKALAREFDALKASLFGTAAFVIEDGQVKQWLRYGQLLGLFYPTFRPKDWVDPVEGWTVIPSSLAFEGITYQRIADLLTGAVEGGSGYWASGFYLIKSADKPVEKPWYCDPAIYAPGLLIEVRENDEDGDGEEKKQVTFESIIKGLYLMKAGSPKHWADIVNDNDDADTSDALLQYAAFGELVYG